MSKSGSALLNTERHDPELTPGVEEGLAQEPMRSIYRADGDLRQQAAERLAAHRSRRGRTNLDPTARSGGADLFGGQEQTINPGGNSAGGARSARTSRSSRIAAAVAERYAQTPSYRAVLAAEAERAIEQAQAAAEIAVVNAQAVVQAQQMILDQLGEMEEAAAREQGGSGLRDEGARIPEAEVLAGLPEKAAVSGGKAKLARDSVRQHVVAASVDAVARGTAGRAYGRSVDETDAVEVRALDEEIAFRQSPVFEEPAEPAQPLPANLIEFPRQLVASRKSRPRYAEGPLREDAPAAGDADQLRIFEVDSEHLSLEPAVAEASPEWASIRLDAMEPVAFEPELQAEAHVDASTPLEAARAEPALQAGSLADKLNYAPRPQTAPISHRVMAALVDCCIVGYGALGFATVFALTVGKSAVSGVFAGQETVPATAVAAVAGVFFVLNLGYKALFFTLSDGTPGMRYARIDLCAVQGGRLTRRAMQRRTVSVLLSSFTVGIGPLWAFFDANGLSLQDRISGMYPRSY